MQMLESIKIVNFKSIKNQTLPLGRLNVFIGCNGAGKSNLVEVFRFLREIIQQHLQVYTIKKGGVDNLLYYGKKVSPFMVFELTFIQKKDLANVYRIRLIPAEYAGLAIEVEEVGFHDRSKHNSPYCKTITLGTLESKLKESNERITGYVLEDLLTYRLYHFHDTSESSPMKGLCSIDDNKYFRENASNLAAFLYYLYQKENDSYKIIVDTIRLIAPFFDDFQLSPSRLNPTQIMVEWKERGTDTYFNASSLSDGTLRFICLATLLLQPQLPALILLDEPELGLHPSAITLLANLLSSASEKTQIVVATQSVTLINQLTPESVWTVERENGESKFKHLKDEDMSNWLENYSLGDLWEKNLLGARP